MFDFGVTKMAIVGGIALIVIGPEKLPRVARTVGHLIGKAQRYVADVKAEVNRSIELEDLKKMKTEFEDAARPAVNAAAYPYTGQSGYECMPQFISDARGPFGRNAAPTRAIRDAIREAGFRTPVVCTGGVHNFKMAESWLADGICDIVGAARQSLADPDWSLKISLGRGAEVRTCEFTNYCEALDQKHKMVTCQLWDRLDLDAADTLRSPDGKRRLVAPDWPAKPITRSGSE